MLKHKGIGAETVFASFQADPTNIDSAAFLITLSEKPTTDLTASKFTLSGTTGSINLVKNSDTSYTATISGMSDGDVVTLSLAADQFSDEAGNQNTASTSTDNSVSYDITAPTGAINPPPVGTSTSPEISGTVDDPTATINVSVNGQTYLATNSGDGTWTLLAGIIAPGLPVGDHNIDVSLTDPAGNSSTYQTSITIQRPPAFAPTVETITWLGGRPIISGSFDSDVVRKLTVRLNGVAYVLGASHQLSASGNYWTLNLSDLEPPLAPGSYDVIVEAELNDGSVLSDSTSAELTVLAPTIPNIITNPGAQTGLANTGVSVWLIELLALGLIAGSLWLLRRRKLQAKV